MEEYYKHLHENPELSGCEYETNKYILDILTTSKVKYYTIDLSIIAYFDKGKNNTLAIRSELDALPLVECESHTIRSKNNNMHACGHDIHTATLLSLIPYIKDNKFNHNIALIFQSKEESGGGSIDIINNYIFDSLKIKKVIGIHVWPNLDFDKLYSNKNLMFGSYEMDIKITGKDNHISSYNKKTDATYASFLVYKKLYKNSPKYIFHLGKITSGCIRNISSKEAKLNYSIRYKNNININKLIMEKRYKTNCFIEYNLLNHYPPLKVSKQLLKLVNYTKIKTLKSAEDFGNYCVKSEILFLLYGLGKANNLHTSTFSTSIKQREKYKNKVAEILNLFKEQKNI